MAAHIDEQQELENFKYFWRNWGRWLFALLIAGAAAYFAWVMYQQHQKTKNGEAAAALAALVGKAQNSKNDKAVQADLSGLQQNYPSSIAAAQATMMVAADAFDKGRYDEAEKQLLWVLQNQKEPFVQALAVQRLATVQMQQKKYDAALATLNTPTDPAFAAAIDETRGDVYGAQGKAKEAAAAYAQALDKTPQDAPGRPLLQLKADTAQ
ncbi:YfgM family protein [Neisseria bacilliformis]|uniref:YfgM family protein n=1 Tax=Neisseria bacilliformis TaxID=267212 RepID=UPI000667823D|nr:tetratricopeptide repeat protein [Neisseria bacilliformis]